MEWFLKGLRTDPVKGISSSTIQERIKAYGTNEIPKPPLAGILL